MRFYWFAGAVVWNLLATGPATAVSCLEGVADSARVYTHAIGLGVELTLAGDEQLSVDQLPIWTARAREILSVYLSEGYAIPSAVPAIFSDGNSETAVIIERVVEPGKGRAWLLMLTGSSEGVLIEGNSLIAFSLIVENALKAGYDETQIRLALLPTESTEVGAGVFLYLTKESKILSKIDKSNIDVQVSGDFGRRIASHSVRLKMICP